MMHTRRPKRTPRIGKTHKAFKNSLRVIGGRKKDRSHSNYASKPNRDFIRYLLKY